MIKKNIFANDVNENEYNAIFQQSRTCMNSNKRFAAAFFACLYWMKKVAAASIFKIIY